MIWNADFVWLHFPKCAGTRTEEIFRYYYSDRPDIHQDVVNLAKDPAMKWHDSLARRMERSDGFRFEDQVVICNFRRLVPWLISRYNYRVTMRPGLPHDPEALLEGKFISGGGVFISADTVALRYLPKEIVFSDKVRLVRVEYFKEDFINCFSPFIDTSVIRDGALDEKINTSDNHLPRDVIDRLYSNSDKVLDKCPHWREIETRFY